MTDKFMPWIDELPNVDQELVAQRNAIAEKQRRADELARAERNTGRAACASRSCGSRRGWRNGRNSAGPSTKSTWRNSGPVTDARG